MKTLPSTNCKDRDATDWMPIQSRAPKMDGLEARIGFKLGCTHCQRMNAMDTPSIEREDSGREGCYVFQAPGEAPAELTFSRPEDALWVIDHTEVPPAYRGQGIGGKLVERVVSDARVEGAKIRPDCPFAAKQFERNPDWADVLAS